VHCSGSASRRATASRTSRPNTHAQLEAFYAVPQIGGVVVPLNYRLLPSDWVYMVNHSGSRVVCVHADYLDLVDTVRREMPAVEHFIALEGGADGWLDYESLPCRRVRRTFAPADDQRKRPADRSNYTSGTSAKPRA
jgi:fatty-acyl-CoA synthase